MQHHTTSYYSMVFSFIFHKIFVLPINKTSMVRALRTRYYQGEAEMIPVEIAHFEKPWEIQMDDFPVTIQPNVHIYSAVINPFLSPLNILPNDEDFVRIVLPMIDDEERRQKEAESEEEEDEEVLDDDLDDEDDEDEDEE